MKQMQMEGWLISFDLLARPRLRLVKHAFLQSSSKSPTASFDTGDYSEQEGWGGGRKVVGYTWVQRTKRRAHEMYMTRIKDVCSARSC